MQAIHASSPSKSRGKGPERVRSLKPDAASGTQNARKSLTRRRACPERCRRRIRRSPRQSRASGKSSCSASPSLEFDPSAQPCLLQPGPRRAPTWSLTEFDTDDFTAELARQEDGALAFAAGHVENAIAGVKAQQFSEPGRKFQPPGWKESPSSSPRNRSHKPRRSRL